MAKLVFKYGAMGSSKTANALMVRYNYMERGKKVLLLKPKIENRDGEKIIRSRIGLEAECEYVEDVIEEPEYNGLSEYDAIIVDEAQFLTGKQVDRLSDIVDNFDIPVLCFGLRADFRGNFFSGSQRLMEIADSIEEIKTICWCGRKATFNARLKDGKVIYTGQQVMMGGNESYIALCRKHYKEGKLKEEDA
jgi:thymidine kinase